MVAAAVTKKSFHLPCRFGLVLVTLWALVIAKFGLAAVLPEDRADVLYHRYNGGGVTVDGPSVLVRVGDEKSVSAWGNFYADSVSSASVDVVTQGSPYDESRRELSVGVDYLHENTMMDLSYTNSDEDDYMANSGHFSINQTMFGDLTTVTLGYSYARDTVKQNEEPDFEEHVTRQNYRLGLSQVLTKNLLIDLAYEAITDEGFLNNPYRSVRYVDPTVPRGYSFQPEKYPNTRTSNAVSTNMMYYLPYRASLRGQYRFYTDTWGINANTVEVGYTHPLSVGWTFDVKYRYYKQSKADFYSDLFPRENATNFRGRDKELSTFADHTIGVGVSYDFVRDGWRFIDKGSLTLKYDRIFFDYSDYRDIRQQTAIAGGEPLYDFTANVWQAFVSIWY